MTVNHRLKTYACPKCTQYEFQPSVGIDDMWTTNPELASLLANPEDGFKYTQSSGMKVDWKCPDCGELIKNKVISHIKNRYFKCPTCKDGMSFPERIIYHLFNSLNINFIHDKTTEWSNNRRYDFYILSHDVIIEIHGKQHFKDMFNRYNGRTIQEEQLNDRIKEKLAKDNGIKDYIVIDARESDFEYIKSNILKSDIATLFNLSDVNWDSINKKSQSSILYEIVRLWNDGYSVKRISENLSKDRNTITKYLKTANDLTMINYNAEISHQRGLSYRNHKLRPIVQLSLEMVIFKIHDSGTIAEMETGINRTSINAVCRGKRKTAGSFYWMYLEDFENKYGKIY